MSDSSGPDPVPPRAPFVIDFGQHASRQPSKQHRTSKWVPIVSGAFFLILFVVWPLLRWLAGVWIDYLWFGELGQKQVWVTNIVSPIVVGLIFGLLAFAILFVNLRIARKMAPKTSVFPDIEGIPEQWRDAISGARARFSPWLDRGILIGSLIIGFFNGLGMASNWRVFRLALERAPFPVSDPQFNQNVGFYVFSYPALRSIESWLLGVLILTTILSLLVHVLDGAIQPWARLKGFAPHVKAHLSVLLALIVLTWGFGYWLDIYALNFSLRGQVAGASYTDVHAQLPAYRILIVISIVSAIILLLNTRYQGWRLPLIALGFWVGASVLIGVIFPALMQQFVVSPNEVQLEAPYIKRNIAMTRQAFGLTAVKGAAFPAKEDLTPADIIADRATLQNVRLWNPEVADRVYGQLQSLRPYYEFPDVDVDRYVIDGVLRQVLVGAREVNVDLLPSTAQTWLNRHLLYTHGFGLVVSPVNEADARGLPKTIVGEVPPRTTTDLKTEQGRIYFGERTNNYVVVDTGIKEFDYPLGQRNAEYEYTGKAGVPVGSLFRRLAFAIRMPEGGQILFSRYIKPESRVVIRRDVLTRLNTVAPFLSFDGDPYPVLVDGRIKWVVDAYTYSEYYPYSQPLGDGTNYLRNSVKAVVDAYDGTTTLYAFDPEDPMLKAWSGIYPDLFTPADKIPAQIREHFRYPTGLFVPQAEVYKTYHMTDPRVFYNKEDSWEIPGAKSGREMQPFFVLMRLPGEVAEHFYLMQPYTPRNRDNMIGWVAANSDPERYGERTVFLFPKERVVLGPEQVMAQVNQDAQISPQLSLWNQRGSKAIFGNMLVIPIKNSIVYIMPLYLEAEQTAIPQLTKVIVSYADKVEMEDTLEQALLKVFGAESFAGKPSAPATVTPDGSIPTTGTPSGAGDVKRAALLYQQAIEAQRKGDWATYGKRLEELGAILSRLAGQETTATAK